MECIDFTVSADGEMVNVNPRETRGISAVSLLADELGLRYTVGGGVDVSLSDVGYVARRLSEKGFQCILDGETAGPTPSQREKEDGNGNAR